MKKRIALTLLILLLIAIPPLCVAEGGGSGAPAPLELAPPQEQFTPGGDDNDAAFDGYVNRLFGIQKPQTMRQMLMRVLGERLTGNDRVVYDALKLLIADVAAGDRASTVFTVTAAQLTLKDRYYAEDLGVDSVVSGNSITAEAEEAMRALSRCDKSKILTMLLRDCPYELYWFDKTFYDEESRIGALQFKGFGIGGAWDSDRGEYYLYFTGEMTFSFYVAGAFGTGEAYTVNTAIAQTASEAAENAQTVVEQYEDDGDYDKLKHYKEWICDNVSYNGAAAQGGVAYGNPWQLIWVFDDDPSTTVVCEGYAKAFQYLCDQSEFEDDVDCRTATGTMNGGNHMWNVVEMPNGKNYMVDVTNCDGQSVGAPDKLFLVGCPDGSVASGYTFALNSGILYAYDEKTRSVYSDAELTLSEFSYIVPIDEAHFPDPAFRAIVAGFDTDPQDGFLSEEELGEVDEMDISEKGIDNLKGIRHFDALETLDCSGNRLASLDLTGMATLTYLYCSGNALVSLDLTNVTALTSLDCSWNALESLDLTGMAALTSLDCSGNALASLDLTGMTALTSLDCYGNALESLDLTGMTALTSLDCSENDLMELSLAGCTGLQTVNCGENGLGTLDVSDCEALTELDCYDNALETIDLSNCAALASLDCSVNGLEALDISTSAALGTLAVHSNLAIDGDVAKYGDDGNTLWFDLGVRLIRSHDALEALTLPAGTEAIQSEAFEGTAIELVVIPQGCGSIGEHAFANCPSLAEVRVPAGLDAGSIDDDAFFGSEDAIIVTTDPDLQAWAADHGMLWTDK